jgi:hypothetical protein
VIALYHVLYISWLCYLILFGLVSNESSGLREILPSWRPKAEVPPSAPKLPMEYMHRHALMNQVVDCLLDRTVEQIVTTPSIPEIDRPEQPTTTTTTTVGIIDVNDARTPMLQVKMVIYIASTDSNLFPFLCVE